MEPATIPNTGSTYRSSDASDGGRDPTHPAQNHLVQSVPLSPEALALLQASKAETGFDGYCAYLDFHGTADPQLKELSSVLKSRIDRPRRTYPQAKWIGSVLNVSKSRSSLVDQIHQLDELGTEIIEALCHPPETACLQIVLWNISHRDDIRSQGNLVDFLGLRYKLDPFIFKAILHLVGSIGSGGSQRSRLDRYKPTHMRVGNAIATFCSSVNQRDCLPVVLIVGPFDESSYGLQEEDSADQFGPCPPFNRSPIPNTIEEALPSSGIYRYYPRLLISSLEQYHNVREDDIHLPSICVLPLLYLNLFEFRCRGRHLRETFDRILHTLDSSIEEGTDYYTLSFGRTRLRLHMVDAENDWCRFVKYMSTHLHHGFSTMPFRQDYEDELKEYMAEADRLESQVRDYMQLQVGSLSLQESRNSIELSNRQMEENKRVKIFTILAFVYVPLNLATSIYGMNLQQLNGSGQSVREFLLTALIALIITGSTWYLVDLLNGYRNWIGTRDRSEPEVTTPKYSKGERVAMITWLVREGHWTWMTRTGAWSRILCNSRKPFRAGRLSLLFSVGELVSMYSSGETWIGDLSDWGPEEMLLKGSKYTA